MHSGSDSAFKAGKRTPHSEMSEIGTLSVGCMTTSPVSGGPGIDAELSVSPVAIRLIFSVIYEQTGRHKRKHRETISPELDKLSCVGRNCFSG